MSPLPPIPDLRAVPKASQDPPFDYVFVVTYGRSGSTLVQGLLNALPRTVCRGENGMYPVHLYRAAEAGVSFGEGKLASREAWTRLARRPYSAFYGVHLLRMERFVESARELMTDLMVGRMRRGRLDRIGFKEVLWHEIAPDETEGFFAWFEACFPGARYLLNTRNIADVTASGFWLRTPQSEAERAIHRVMEIQDHLRTTRPDRVYDVRFEEVTSKEPGVAESQLRGLAEFVTGSCTPDVLAALLATLDVGHGPHPFGKSKPKDTP